MKTKITIAYSLDRGIKRKDNPNQDSVNVVLPSFFRRKPPMIALSDGMGGYGGGEIASDITVKSVAKYYKKNKAKNGDYAPILEGGIFEAHKNIKERAEKSADLEWMGCTIVAAVLLPDRVFVANVGDSRAYLISPMNGIRQISYDHSFVAEQVRAELITKEEAQNHPKKNILTLSLTGRREKADPFQDTIEWKDGDLVLLCSDGLWGTVSEEQIFAVTVAMEPQAACEKLIKMANMNQGPDNISVIIARNGAKIEVPEDADDETNQGIQVNQTEDDHGGDETGKLCSAKELCD